MADHGEGDVKKENALARVYRELGIPTLLSSPRDVKLLLVTRFLRLFSYGQTTLILALFLRALHISVPRIGLFMSLTLFGDVLSSLLLTLIADKIGRRRMLGFGALLIVMSGIVFATSDNYWILVATSIVGVISPSGNEIGPFRAIEESTIASLVRPDERADLFAWYVLLGTLSRALGNLVCGWTVTALQNSGWTPLESYKFTFILYSAIGVCNVLVTFLLSHRCEEVARKPTSPETQPLLAPPQSDPSPEHPELKLTPLERLYNLFPHISRESRAILIKLCLLFGIDSIASGLMPASLITLYFHIHFHFPEGALGTLFFTTNLVSSAGNLLASAVARRIGLIKTMVFTHLPSAVFLALIPLSPNVYPAIAFLVFRSLLGSMDQAPRSAFLSAVMKPSERTAVMGIVTVSKTLAGSTGPVLTGLLAGTGLFWVSFVISGGMKVAYDLGLLFMFVSLHDVGKKDSREGQQVVTPNSRDGDEEETPRPSA